MNGLAITSRALGPLHMAMASSVMKSNYVKAPGVTPLHMMPGVGAAPLSTSSISAHPFFARKPFPSSIRSATSTVNSELAVGNVLEHVNDITAFAEAEDYFKMQETWPAAKNAMARYLPAEQKDDLPETFFEAGPGLFKLLANVRPHLSNTLVVNAYRFEGADTIMLDSIGDKIRRGVELGVVARFAGEYLLETAALTFPDEYRDENNPHLATIIGTLTRLPYKQLSEDNSNSLSMAYVIDALEAFGISSTLAKAKLIEAKSVRDLFCLCPNLQTTIEHRLARIVQGHPYWDILRHRYCIYSYLLEKARDSGVISGLAFRGAVKRITEQAKKDADVKKKLAEAKKEAEQLREASDGWRSQPVAKHEMSGLEVPTLNKTIITITLTDGAVATLRRCIYLAVVASSALPLVNLFVPFMNYSSSPIFMIGSLMGAMLIALGKIREE